MATTIRAKRAFFLLTDDTLGFKTGVPGWTFGERWNGWACPCFEEAETVALLDYLTKDSQSNPQVETLTYERKGDVFTLTNLDRVGDEDYEPETFEAAPIDTTRGTRKVWSVGSFAWCWTEHDDYKVRTTR